MAITLTEKGIASARPNDGKGGKGPRRDVPILGTRGLILRVEPSRGNIRRTFRFRGTLKGASKVWTLGVHPILRVVDVRKLHAECVHAIDHDEDPQPLIDRWHASVIPEAIGGVDGPTVADVMKEFMIVAARTRKRPEAAQATIDRDILPTLGEVPVAALTKRHFVELLDRIVRRGSPVQANRVQQLLHRAFVVAADRDLIGAIPAMPRALQGGEEKARERVLDDAEVIALWRGLDTLSPADKRQKITRPLAIALKLLLVTAQRRGELAAAKWSDISETATEIAGADGNLQRVKFKVWNIPQTKTDRPHAVPLSPLACRLLEELRALVPEESAECFPSKRTAKANAERDRSITRAARRARDELKMAEWTPHDLRRTARTSFARLGVADAVSERILNHVSGDRMIQVYNRHGYLLEMRQALDAWAARIEKLDAETPR
jgi:integrase